MGDSNCPMEESVESLLPEIDIVQSKVPFDHNENNPSDITPNSRNDNEHESKLQPTPRKFCKSTKPVQSPLCYIEKPIPKLHQNLHRLMTYQVFQLTSRVPVQQNMGLIRQTLTSLVYFKIKST